MTASIRFKRYKQGDASNMLREYKTLCFTLRKIKEFTQENVRREECHTSSSY